MARLKLSPSGLRSPLDLSTDDDPLPAGAELKAARLVRRPEPPVAPEPAPAAAPDHEPVAPTTIAPTGEPVASASPAPPAAPVLEDAPTPTADDLAPAPALPTSDLPEWAAGLEPEGLAPSRLLGRPKQTALILDRELSTRADALVAATGPRVTFAAIVTAVLHFHLPADGDEAARAIGGYRRRRLDTLDHPWEERNARLPEPLRDRLDAVVQGATGRVAGVHRSTLVNALLDAHLPGSPDDASRLVTRMEMVRGGAFLDLLA